MCQYNYIVYTNINFNIFHYNYAIIIILLVFHNVRSGAKLMRVRGDCWLTLYLLYVTTLLEYHESQSWMVQRLNKDKETLLNSKRLPKNWCWRQKTRNKIITAKCTTKKGIHNVLHIMYGTCPSYSKYGACTMLLKTYMTCMWSNLYMHVSCRFPTHILNLISDFHQINRQLQWSSFIN